MCPVRPEVDRLAGLHEVVGTVHGHRQLSGQDVQQFPGTRRMVGRVVPVVRRKPPLPQLDEVRLVQPAEQPPEPAVATAPQQRRIGRRGHPHRPLGGRFEQPADRDTEGVGDAGQGTHAGVCPGGLDLDDHALADPGPPGQLVQ